MDLKSLAKGMSLRMPWSIGQPLLEETGAPRGRGWAKTAEKIGDWKGGGPIEIEALGEALRQHTLAGEKSVALYATGAASRGEMIAKASGLHVPKSAAAEIYPCLLDEDALATEAPEIKLVSVEVSEAEVALVFSSIRFTTIRETITADQITENEEGILEQYDEVYGVKHVRTQAIDVIVIPQFSPYVELRVDHPLGMNAAQAAFALQQLEATASSILNVNVSGAINLFSLIQRMYDNEDEGFVVELAFGTTTASLKHEKMRRAGLDLRKEIYHKGGKAALSSPIEPHKVSIVWQRSEGDYVNSKPELTLSCDARLANSENSIVVQAAVRKCRNEEDYNFVRDRLLTYLAAG